MDLKTIKVSKEVWQRLRVFAVLNNEKMSDIAGVAINKELKLRGVKFKETKTKN